MSDYPTRKQDAYRPFYQAYSKEEDSERARSHYEQPVEFFYPLLGGEWNVYSCNVWLEGATTDTQAQQAHLDLLARLMNLQPGQRVLDVGCGWGGPLVYLCRTYGVRGVGITVSPQQKQAAEARIARYGVDAQIEECHWQDYTDPEGFDVIYSDEVIVHFNDLGGFFAKAYSLLHDSGRMVHKELHITYPIQTPSNRAISFVNEIFGETGNYRTLAEELTLTNNAGFAVRRVQNIALGNYVQSMDHWLANMRQHRPALEAAVGSDVYQRYRTYFNIMRQVFAKGTEMTLDVVVSHKIADPA
jgi:cyclopropane-fatty-acyl-phospholipid synthase